MSLPIFKSRHCLSVKLFGSTITARLRPVICRQCSALAAGPAHVPDEPLRVGMTVVIQPNVVTRDGKAGVQTGELVLVTATGIEPLRGMPRGFLRV
jgi:hypothetical protein